MDSELLKLICVENICVHMSQDQGEALEIYFKSLGLKIIQSKGLPR